jgi:hypothetical protein
MSLIRQLARIRLKPIIGVITVFVVKRSGNKRQWIILLTIATIFLLSVLFGYSSVFALYLYGRPFCLDAFHVGLITLAQGLTIFLMSSLIILCKKTTNDTYIFPILGSIALIVGLSVFSVAKKMWLVYIGKVIVVVVSSFVFCCFSFILLAACIGSLFFITLPILRAKLTKFVELNEYAVVFVAAGIIETVGHDALGAVSNGIYNASLQFFPGLVFLVFAITGAFPLAIMRYDCC